MRIVDQYGREYEKPQAKKPVAELGVAGISDPFREYVADGLTPDRLAQIFRQADAGDMRAQAELFETLEERDAHILCERDKRRNVVIDLQLKVEPASDNARDLRVAEFVQQQITALSDWEDSLITMQDAVGKGFSSMELKWDVSEGQAMVYDMPVVPQRRFLFHDDAGVPSRVPRLITEGNMMGEDIPAWSTITHIYGGKTGSATRSAIYRVCAWMTLFKTYAIKDWAVFAEVYGMPLRLGKYDSGANEDDRKALRRAVTSIGTDAAGIISKNTEIEFIETTKGAAAADLWEKLASFCNRENSKAILGQTLTAELNGGSLAAASVHNEVRLDLLKADGRALAATTRSQLVKPLIGFNFGFDTALPKISLVFKEDEDLVVKSNWVGKLLDSGVVIPASFINKSFGIPAAEKGEAMVGGAPEATVAKVVAKEGVATAHEHALGKLGALPTSAEEMVVAARTLLDEVDSLEEYRDKLLLLVADLDLKDQGIAMARAMVVADLAGQFDENAR